MQNGPVLELGSQASQDGAFGNTDWWVIRQAGEGGQPEAERARAQLCGAYWKPVFRYIRRTGRSFEDSEDFTQEFFARLLLNNSLRSAAREKGKFRSFLLTLLKRFLSDQRDRARCQKRGAGKPPVSLDSADTEFRRRHEPVDGQDPESICERTWAQSLLDEALGQLRRESMATGSGDLFQVLRPLVVCETERTYAMVASELCITEANVKVMVHRLRRRLRGILRAVIERSGTPHCQVDAEFHDIYSVLAS